MISVVRPGSSRSSACSIIASGMAVEGARRLVEDQDSRIAQDRAGDCDALALTAGETHAALSDFRVVTARERAHEVVDVGLARRAADFVVGRIEPSVADVLQNRRAKQLGILGNDRDRAAQIREAHRRDVDAVDPNRALLRNVEARNEVDDRRLAGARRPD